MAEHTSQVNLDLRTFERRNSTAGRFARYCRGRIKSAPPRLLVILSGSLTLTFLINWQAGVLTALVALGGEAFDLWVLWTIVRGAKGDTCNPRKISLTVLTGGIQALTIAFCVAVAWIRGGPDARFFAIAFLTGAVINGALVTRFHPAAIYVKQAIYIATAVLLFASDFLTPNWWSRDFAFDVFGTILFAYMIWVILTYVVRQDKRRIAFEHALLKEKYRTDRIHKALLENENKARRLALVARHANDSVVITNFSGQIVWVNHTFEKITGYTKQEVLGKDRGELMKCAKTDPEPLAKIAKAVVAKSPIRVEVESATKSGEPIWIETSVTPILDDNGRVANVIGVERDITTAKAKEFELAQAKRDAEHANQAKSNFLATMSHEIRTPMNGIIGMADLLRQTQLHPEQHEYLATIITSGESLLQIINDILDFSKLDANKMSLEARPFDLQDTVQSVVALLRPIANEKGVDLHLEMADGVVPTLIGDAGRIRQIAINLIGNAIKFTPAGDVVVTMYFDVNGQECLAGFAVTDTGIGIAPEKIDGIFDTFSQAEQETSRKFGGTGLGLSIARRLAQKMNGDITVYSVLNVGSTFDFCCRLDVAEPGVILQHRRSLSVSAGADAVSGLRLLVAEDNKTNRLLIKKMLADLDIDLCFAKNGIEAVELYKSWRPELVLMDLSMPERDGLQATSDIRNWEREAGLSPCPIFALTANAFEEDRERCTLAGMDDFLTKPVTKAVLLQALTGIAGDAADRTEPEFQAETE